MAVSFQLPPELEQDLRQALQDLDGEAREALLVDLYRRGKLSPLALSAALGVDRIELEQVLHKHLVTEDLGSVEDYLADERQLRQIRAKQQQ